MRRIRLPLAVWAILILVVMASRGDLGRPFCDVGVSDCLVDLDPLATWVARASVALALILAGWVAIAFVDATIQAVRRGAYGSPPSWLRLTLLSIGMAFWLLVSALVALVRSVVWGYDCAPSATDCAASATRNQLGQTTEAVVTGTAVLIVGWAVIRVITAIGVRRPVGPLDTRADGVVGPAT